MDKNKLFKEAKAHTPSSRGLSMQEVYDLSLLPKIKVTKQITEAQAVLLAKNTIYRTLGRDNITGKDLRNAIVNLIQWKK